MDSARTAVRAVAGASDARTAASIGRRARLELVFVRRGGRTVLSHQYAEPPYHVGRASACGDAASVIVACTGPGIFAGDDLHQVVRVEEGARVLLRSQSALQVHPGAPACAARLHQEFSVACGGELHCQWDPVIPFDGSGLEQQVDLQLGADSRLFWSDALMTGRAGRGEAWRCAALAHEIRVVADGRLLYLERYRVRPVERDVGSRWSAGSAAFLGTALVYHPDVTDAAAESLQADLNAFPAVRAGVDVPDARLAVGRLAASHGVTFTAARGHLRAWAVRAVFADQTLRFRT